MARVNLHKIKHSMFIAQLCKQQNVVWLHQISLHGFFFLLFLSKKFVSAPAGPRVGAGSPKALVQSHQVSKRGGASEATGQVTG